VERAPELTLHILHKEHPQIAKAISDRLDSLLPSYVFTDMEQVPELLESFCRIRGVDVQLMKGEGPRPIVARHRREFMAVLLLCYQPEKMYGLTSGIIKSRLVLHISRVLGCSAKNIMKEVPFHFKVYQDFRNAVLSVHDKLLELYQVSQSA